MVGWGEEVGELGDDVGAVGGEEVGEGFAGGEKEAFAGGAGDEGEEEEPVEGVEEVAEGRVRMVPAAISASMPWRMRLILSMRSEVVMVCRRLSTSRLISRIMKSGR